MWLRATSLLKMGRPLEARGVGVVPDMRIFVGLTGTETERAQRAGKCPVPIKECGANDD